MHPVDYAVVICYLVGLAVAGCWLARRAAASSEHYFLGGRKLPWWALGASGMSSNLDVAGTMTIVTLLTVYGLQGFFIEMRGGVVLPIAVFLAFMGKWHQRSQVMTTAEWMTLRFGKGAGGRAARAVAALTYVVLTVAMIVFFLSAGGSFLAEFLPFTAVQCAVGMALIAFVYTLVGGLYGVIWTDVFQAALIGGAALYVAVRGAGVVTPELLESWQGAELNQFLPMMGGHEGLAPYGGMFGAFILVWAFKGVLEGLGGSGGSAYMAQRFYAAGDERECRKLAMLWTVLFAARWPMVLGFALLALSLGLDVSSLEEAEQVLPRVLNSEFFPVGLKGLMLAALLAAAMSTFDSTINAGASYVVRDLYEPLRKNATERERVWAGYIASTVLVALGLGFALALGAGVLSLWVGIVMLLFPAFLVPFALRWYWGRFNGPGFAWGVAGGFAASLWVALADPQGAGWNEATRFLVIAGVSLVVAVVATLVTRPVEDGVAREFFQRVRPFGFWPRSWRDEEAGLAREQRRDLVALAGAIMWQLLTFLAPMAAVLGRWDAVVVMTGPWFALGWWLWRDCGGRRAPEARA
jgi:SSS family solute:Na+ symporter